VRFLRKDEQAYKQRMPGLHERYTYVYRCRERFSHGSRRDEAMTNYTIKEVVRIEHDGRVIWNGREVKTDDEFRAAMLALKDALTGGYYK
jgi:hypothetical protein